MPGRNTHETGQLYEKIAADFLADHGLILKDCDYRCKAGELDIVACEGRIWVFTEVKYRQSGRAGDPAEAVDARKQHRIYQAAQWYLKEKGLPQNTPCRFDVIAITAASEGTSSNETGSDTVLRPVSEGLPSCRVRWIRNAFGCM